MVKACFIERDVVIADAGVAIRRVKLQGPLPEGILPDTGQRKGRHSAYDHSDDDRRNRLVKLGVQEDGREDGDGDAGPNRTSAEAIALAREGHVLGEGHEIFGSEPKRDRHALEW